MSRWVWLVLLLAAAPVADAHLMNTGFGPFYDGLTHLFLTPEDLLPVIALALLAGLRGALFGRGVLFVLPLAWVAGNIAGLFFAPHLALPAVVLTIVLGALVAADRALPLAVVLGLAAGLGLLHGTDNGTELARMPAPVQIAAGVATAVFVVVALLAGQAAAVRAPWGRVAFRVAGSWIVAIGLFMLGWSLRPAG